MAGLTRPRATVCKFPALRNYAVTQVSATGFEPGTVRLRIQRATTAPPRHQKKKSKIDNQWKWHENNKSPNEATETGC